jgi:hypothetical protein
VVCNYKKNLYRLKWKVALDNENRIKSMAFRKEGNDLKYKKAGDLQRFVERQLMVSCIN